MLRRTLGSALLLLLTAAAIFWKGAAGLVWLLAILALGAQVELVRLVQRLSPRVEIIRWQLYGWTVAIILGAWYLGPLYGGIWLSLLALLASVFRGVATSHPSLLLHRLLPTVLCLLYVPFALQFAVLLLRCEPDTTSGIWLLAWVVCVCKCSDIGGLLAGVTCGRHSLAREYSPSKTWEGFFGGLLLSLGGGTVLWSLGRSLGHLTSLSLRLALALSTTLAVIATVSDLLESAIKRQARVKNSGCSIPGIGGCLDLCDSLILSLPTAYAVFQLAGR
ncbi:MAG: phosphatidate cytidylyltransferase [Puniceicoccales bacterium]|jgi:phosphatidate cytidylyltransferase|nr:phosphatidate cytidylyltransferase [Puniceicoccales bacterium]